MSIDYKDDPDYCPVSNDGRHKYFIFKTFETYEPYEPYYSNTVKIEPLYVQREYANSGCACGRVIKQRIVEGKA